MFQFGKRSLDNLEEVENALAAVAKLALSYSEVDFTVTDGSRTQAEQDELYAQGRTKPGPKVTWTRNSRHIDPDGHGPLEGRAIDVAPYVDGKVVWGPAALFQKIADAFFRAAKELGVEIEWGGHWDPKNIDMPHFQLKAGWKPAPGQKF